jgi:peptidoglycan-associated lipoprotein
MNRCGSLGLAAAVCAALICGCSSTKPPAPAAIASTPQASAPATSAPAAKPAPVVAVPDYLNPLSPVSRQRSVYFGFDQSTLQPQYRNVIDVQGHYLSSHPAVSVRVEGNTDERGSAEYNLALGQRRAQAVVSALKVYGVRDTQMEAISWGEEKPRAEGHDEAAWSQNRRADVVYPPK